MSLSEEQRTTLLFSAIRSKPPCLRSGSLLTLRHFALLAALDALAVVIPGDGRVGQARHFAFQQRLFAVDHLRVSQRLDKVRHGPLLHLAVQHFGLLRDGRHLLQLGPEGRDER